MDARERLQRWETATEIPLALAAVIFLFAYAVPILTWPDTPPAVAVACEVIIWVTWALFAVDYLVRLLMSHERLRFVKKYWFDLIIIVLPVMRPLRLLRLITVLQVVNRRASSNLRGRVGVYVGAGAALLAIVGALAVLDAERGVEGSNIATYGDALWWAAATMTTVGYGDTFPVSTTGRAVAVGLMLCGIAILGTATATLSSFLVGEVAEASAAESHATNENVSKLALEVASLREALAAQTAAAEPPRGGADPEAG